MELSNKGEYTLKALMYLAKEFKNSQNVVKTREIAKQTGIPRSFLEQILLQLNNARFLESVKGPQGGYRLRRPPEEIVIGDVIRIVDGALSPYHDVTTLRDKIDESEDFSSIYKMMLEVRDAIAEILDHKTLSDLI